MIIAQTLLVIQIMSSLIAYSEVFSTEQYITLSLSLACCFAMIPLINYHSSIAISLLIAQVSLAYSVQIEPQFNTFEGVFFVLLFWVLKNENNNWLYNIGFIASLAIALSLQEYEMPQQIVRSVLCGVALSICYICYKNIQKTQKQHDNSSEGKLIISQLNSAKDGAKDEVIVIQEHEQLLEKCQLGIIVIDEDTYDVKFANHLIDEIALQVNQSVNDLLDYIIIDKIDKQARQMLKQYKNHQSLRNLLKLLVSQQQSMRVSVLNYNSNALKNYSIVINYTKGLAITVYELKERDTYLKRHYQNQVMKQLFTTFSHEFGTSLNYMLALAQTAIENFPEQTEYFEPIRCTGQILHNFVMGMVDFNDIQGKSFSLQLEQVDVNQVMYDIVQLFTHQVTKKGLTIEFKQYHNSIPLYSDARRIKEVLVNLVSNSQKFTYTGGIILSAKQISQNTLVFSVNDTGIGMTPAEAKRLRDMLRLDLKLEDQISSNTAGFGLGCFISNKIAKKLSQLKYDEGGGLQLFEFLGQGMSFRFHVDSTPFILPSSIESSSGIQKISKTAFVDLRQSILNHSSAAINLAIKNALMKKQTSFFFPLQLNRVQSFKIDDQILENLSPLKQSKYKSDQVNQETSNGEFEQRIRQLKRNSTKFLSQEFNNQFQTYKIVEESPQFGCDCTKILIVDDEMINIMGLQIMLRQFDLKCDSAFNGQDALNKIQANQKAHCKYSLVFMDINMPILDGFQATKVIVKEFEQPPSIVACTAYNDADTKQKCYEVGMSHFLNKPVNKLELTKILQFMNFV